MAATVGLSETNGNPGSQTDPIDNMNFGSTDAPNLDQFVWPIRHSLPRSFIKYFRVLLISLGGSSLINNFRIWATYSYTNFENVISGGLTTTNSSPQPYAIPTNVSNLGSGFPVLPNADPGAQNLGIGGSLNNTVTVSIPQTATPYSNYFAQQMQIDIGGTSAVGPLNTVTYHIQYDEA